MGEVLNIICWKWKKPNPPSTKSGKEFHAIHVNTLYSMLQRHLHIPYTLICITDEPAGIRPEVRVLPMVDTFSKLGGCYRRLILFDPNVNGDYGKRFVCMDLDVVIVDDVTPIFSNKADFIIWGEDARKTPYCGSMWMMDAGSRPRVFRIFNNNPDHAVTLSKRKYQVGSDQSFISYCLYPKEKTWTTKDGIYNFKLDVRKAPPIIQKKMKRMTPLELRAVKKGVRGWKQKRLEKIEAKKIKKEKKIKTIAEEINGHTPMADYQIIILNKPTGKLPSDARMVFFNGKFDPSDTHIQKENPWIPDHWR